MTVSAVISCRPVLAAAVLALALGGCAAERFSFAGNPFSSSQQPAPVQASAPGNAGAGDGGQRYAGPPPATFVAPLPAGSSAALTPQPAPGQRVTDAPVGAGVNIPAGDKEDFIVNVGRRVFFTEGSAALTNIARETLDNQAAWLRRHPSWSVKIQGFADDPGNDQANTALGQQRANAVLTYLASKGVATTRMRAKTYGRTQDRLVNACADASCKAQNRRVITNLETGRGR